MIRYFEWAIDDTLSEDAWHQTDRYDEVISFRAAQRTARPGFRRLAHLFPAFGGR